MAPPLPSPGAGAPAAGAPRVGLDLAAAYRAEIAALRSGASEAQLRAKVASLQAARAEAQAQLARLAADGGGAGAGGGRSAERVELVRVVSAADAGIREATARLAAAARSPAA